MLFEPDRHEALAGPAWDAAAARQAVQAIADDIAGNRLANGHWLLHPQDAEAETPADGTKSLYSGSAGTVWALWYLRQQGAATVAMDFQAAMAQADRDYQAAPDTGEVIPSYFLGEVGILLARWRIDASDEVAERLHAAIRRNIPNPTNEALWAAPGTMVAAWHLWKATGQARWRSLFLDNVEQLWRTWLPDAQTDCHLWTQDMYGHVLQHLGAGHGFAGNVYALLQGAELLDETRRAQLFARCVATLQATAVWEDGAANWPPYANTPPGVRDKKLMQWCHGAPGIVTGLAHFPVGVSAAMDTMLVGAATAVWQAGPLCKGHGLCHGTAGNGYAFLKMHRRTGDAVWLERARAFAMHAMVQRERLLRQHGRGRYTLWTGDPGLAVYLWHCITGEDAMPGLDTVG